MKLENANPSTSNKDFKSTRTSTSTSKQVKGNFDFPLKDKTMEDQAKYFATELKEAKLLPKYRYAVLYYPTSLLEALLAKAKEMEMQGKLIKGRAAYFWGSLKRIPPRLQKQKSSLE